MGKFTKKSQTRPIPAYFSFVFLHFVNGWGDSRPGDVFRDV